MERTLAANRRLSATLAPLSRIPAASAHSIDCPGFPKKGYKPGSVRRGKRTTEPESSSYSRSPHSGPQKKSETRLDKPVDATRPESSRMRRRNSANSRVGRDSDDVSVVSRTGRRSTSVQSRRTTRPRKAEDNDNVSVASNVSRVRRGSPKRRPRRGSNTAPPVTKSGKQLRRGSMQRRNSNSSQQHVEYEFGDDEVANGTSVRSTRTRSLTRSNSLNFGKDQREPGQEQAWPSPWEDDPFKSEHSQRQQRRSSATGSVQGRPSAGRTRVQRNHSGAAAAATTLDTRSAHKDNNSRRLRHQTSMESDVASDVMSVDSQSNCLRDAAAIQALGGSSSMPRSPRRSTKTSFFSKAPPSPNPKSVSSRASRKSSATEPSTASEASSASSPQPRRPVRKDGTLAVLRRMTRRASASMCESDARSVVSSFSRLQRRPSALATGPTIPTFQW